MWIGPVVHYCELRLDRRRSHSISAGRVEFAGLKLLIVHREGRASAPWGRERHRLIGVFLLSALRSILEVEVATLLVHYAALVAVFLSVSEVNTASRDRLFSALHALSCSGIVSMSARLKS